MQQALRLDELHATVETKLNKDDYTVAVRSHSAAFFECTQVYSMTGLHQLRSRTSTSVATMAKHSSARSLRLSPSPRVRTHLPAAAAACGVQRSGVVAPRVHVRLPSAPLRPHNQRRSRVLVGSKDLEAW
jgi:hypothetical protein